MVKFSYESYLNKKRGVSSIVGGIIFLVLLSAGFSTFFLAMDVQSDTIDAQRSISDLIIDKTKEKFTIAASIDKDDSNRLGIQLKNLGSNPVFVNNIWIINNSGDFPAKKHLIDYKDSVIPPGYGTDILENTPLFMKVDDYDIKVVSTLGTIKKADLTVGADNNMRAKLIAIPPDVKVGQNVTLTMHVENIGNSRLLNVVPFGDYPNIVPPFTTPNPSAPTPVDLNPGEGVFFTWKYETTGFAGSIVIFDSYATAQEEDTGFTYNSNVAVEKIELREPGESQSIVLEKDLFSRPEMFLVIPAPMGTSDGYKGLWGANIVNTTPAPMKVSRLTITLLSPRENSSDLMFNPTSSPSKMCDPEAVGPTNTADWKCLVQNQLSWTNLATPITIPPFSAHQFTAKVHTDRMASCCPRVPAVIVVADVFTNVGEFSKAGYSSSFDDAGTAIVNTYLSTDPWSTVNADIITTDLAIPDDTPITFYATLTDFEKGARIIKADDTKFIINVPKDWIIEDPINDIDGLGDFSIVYSPWPDGSSQIVGTLLDDYDGTERIGRSPGQEGLSIEFTARSPTLTSNERMYVMYILADGFVDGNTSNIFPLGPLSEVVLQVVP